MSEEKKPYLVIMLDEEDSVPVVHHYGDELKNKQLVKFRWETQTDKKDQAGFLDKPKTKVDIQYIDEANELPFSEPSRLLLNVRELYEFIPTLSVHGELLDEREHAIFSKGIKMGHEFKAKGKDGV